MQVQSPVGKFPLKVRRVRVERRGVSVDAALGAWPAEVTFERSDVVVAVGALLALVLSFLLGRASAAPRDVWPLPATNGHAKRFARLRTLRGAAAEPVEERSRLRKATARLYPDFL